MSVVLNEERVAADAAFVRYHLLKKARPVAVGYEPGNMTLYRLVFTPVGESPVLERAGTVGLSREMRESDEWAFVSWVGYGCAPMQLLGQPGLVPVAGYICEKLGGNAADGEALYELFVRIASPQ